MTNPQSLAGLTAEEQGLHATMIALMATAEERGWDLRFNRYSSVKAALKSLARSRALLAGVEEAYDKKVLDHWFRTNRDAIAAELEGTEGE